MKPAPGDLIFEILRDEKRPDRTLGKLSLKEAGIYFDTLEDQVRPAGQKIPGETAIPAGLYRVVISLSPHFKRRTPEILDVPNFTGIRIHCGVRPLNTRGCPLVSSRGVTLENGDPVLIFDDRVAEDKLTAFLDSWTEANPTGQIWVDIRESFPEGGF